MTEGYAKGYSVTVHSCAKNCKLLHFNTLQNTPRNIFKRFLNVYITDNQYIYLIFIRDPFNHFFNCWLFTIN
jgi:hypothetical protein